LTSPIESQPGPIVGNLLNVPYISTAGYKPNLPRV
jgi:hypothetical protein